MMRTLTFAVLVVLFAPLAVFAQSPAGRTAAAAPPAVKKLSRAEFDALANTPSRLLLVDVRRPDEVTSIGGFAVYFSVQAADLQRQLPFIPRDRVIVTVPNHAARASRAAELLKKEGFNVAGAIGAQDYEAEGGSLIRIAPPKQTSDAARDTAAATAR